MIAANVDFVIVVQSCHYDFNLKRLERYLVMVKDGGAIPIILLTKIDLMAPDVLAAQIGDIRSAGITEPVMTAEQCHEGGRRCSDERPRSGQDVLLCRFIWRREEHDHQCPDGP